MTSGRIRLYDKSQAVLVGISHHRPIYCRALERAIPYAVQIFDEHHNLIAICNLDGETISNEITPLGLASDVPDDIRVVFARWEQKRYTAMQTLQ